MRNSRKNKRKFESHHSQSISETQKQRPELANHVGAVENQMITTITPGSGQVDTGKNTDQVNHDIDPRDEITSG